MVTSLEKSQIEEMSAWNSHDIDKMVSYYTDDCIYDNAGLGVVSHGKKELKEYFVNLFNIFPDARFEMNSYFRSGDWGAGEWTMSGTHSGNSPGIPATGKNILNKGALIEQYRNGKIYRHTDYWNMVEFLQQIGMMPAAPPK